MALDSVTETVSVPACVQLNVSAVPSGSDEPEPSRVTTSSSVIVGWSGPALAVGTVISNVQVFDVAVVGPVLVAPSVAASCATVATTVSSVLSAARSVRS